MAWQNELVEILEHVINDPDNEEFGVETLQRTLVVAAQLIFKKVSWDKDYKIEVDKCEIKPDPTKGTKDNDFINLTVLKAAEILARSRFKTNALNAIEVRDDFGRIDARERGRYFQALAEEAKQAFEDAIFNKQLNGTIGDAIITPTTYLNVHPLLGHFS